MATQILVPVMGEAIGEARLATWLKHAGDPVRRGDELAELETDKAVLMLECPADGVLLEVLVGEGAMVTTGQLLAHVGRAGELVHPAPNMTSAAASPVQAEAAAHAYTSVFEGITSNCAEDKVESSAGTDQRPRVSPAARRMARRLGIDVMELVAVKAPARVTTQDVARYRDETIV